MVAAKLETMKHGGGRRSADQDANLRLDRASAARALNVSSRCVTSAKAVRDHGVPELIQRVEQGGVAISVAAGLARLPKPEQRKLAAAPAAVLRGAVKQFRRTERETELAVATKAASARIGTKLYGVLYADPPWRFEPWSRDTGMDRAADNRYPTMTLADIKAIKVPAVKDCALFLWATAPMLPQAEAVMGAWGFTYRSYYGWLKPGPGHGYWSQSDQLELLLLGIRGDVPAPAPGTQPPQVQIFPRGRHSEKPTAYARMIVTMFPNTPKLEMFARGPRDGWDVWGNEVLAGEVLPRGLWAC